MISRAESTRPTQVLMKRTGFASATFCHHLLSCGIVSHCPLHEPNLKGLSVKKNQLFYWRDTGHCIVPVADTKEGKGTGMCQSLDGKCAADPKTPEISGSPSCNINASPFAKVLCCSQSITASSCMRNTTSTHCSVWCLVSQTFILFPLICTLPLPSDVVLTAVLPGSHFVTAQDVIMRRNVSTPKRMDP